MKEGVVLLKGAFACLLTGRKICTCPALAHDRAKLSHGAPFDCADDDCGDVAFIWATKFIGGRDAVEEFLACGVCPLATGVGFERVAVSMPPILKLKIPLPKFVAARKDDEDDVKFLARVELDAEGIMGSYTRPEHDACIAGLRNRDCLNHVFEVMGVAYGPRLVPGSDGFTEASKKRQADAAGKTPVKRPRAPKKKKVESAKVSVSWGKTSLKRPSDVEVASVRPVKLSKKTVSYSAAVASTTCVALVASGPKGAASASGSKGAASAKKAITPVQKCRVPAIGVMAEASSAKSQESSPHGQTPRDSAPEFASMPEPDASLRIAHGAGGVSILDLAGTIAAG
jgi:hypothetical protein